MPSNLSDDDSGSPPRRDILKSRTTLALVYALPTGAMVATAIVDTSQLAKGAVWAASLAVMGGACLFNAWRCGRVHCFFTGPFFILVGLVALLHGMGAVSLGIAGWSWLGALILIGGVGLSIGPERLWGSYRENA